MKIFLAILGLAGTAILLVGGYAFQNWFRVRRELKTNMNLSCTDLTGTDEEAKAGEFARTRLMKRCYNGLMDIGPEALYWATYTYPVLLGQDDATWWISKETQLVGKSNSDVVNDFIFESNKLSAQSVNEFFSSLHSDEIPSTF